MWVLQQLRVRTTSGRKVVGAAKCFNPEQATGQSVGLPSNQFTLGVIGYLLLTGALPSSGNARQLLEAIVSGEPNRFENERHKFHSSSRTLSTSV